MGEGLARAQTRLAQRLHAHKPALRSAFTARQRPGSILSELVSQSDVLAMAAERATPNLKAQAERYSRFSVAGRALCPAQSQAANFFFFSPRRLLGARGPARSLRSFVDSDRALGPRCAAAAAEPPARIMMAAKMHGRLRRPAAGPALRTVPVRHSARPGLRRLYSRAVRPRGRRRRPRAGPVVQTQACSNRAQ